MTTTKIKAKIKTITTIGVLAAAVIVVGAAAYILTPQEKRVAAAKAQRIEKMCAEMIEDAVPGDERRTIRKICNALNDEQVQIRTDLVRNESVNVGKPGADPVFAVPITELSVNLASQQGTSGETFLRTSMLLVVADESSRLRAEEMMPLIRSKLLLLLSSKEASVLSKDAGHKQLASEILSELSALHLLNKEPLKISDVRFLTFLIQ